MLHNGRAVFEIWAPKYTPILKEVLASQEGTHVKR
jgi:hypothetical protein